MINYYNEVQGFINYALFNLRNISESDIRCSCKSCKNKKFLNSDIVTMHFLQQKVHEEIPALVCTLRTICFPQYHDKNHN